MSEARPDAIGGGVCQVSMTVFNAAFERKEYVEPYVIELAEPGRDVVVDPAHDSPFTAVDKKGHLTDIPSARGAMRCSRRLPTRSGFLRSACRRDRARW